MNYLVRRGRAGSYSLNNWRQFCPNRRYLAAEPAAQKTIKIYRYDPNIADSSPKLVSYKVDLDKSGQMYLDMLNYVKDSIDPTLSFRRSCREGICGSCAMNINGENKLACLTKIDPDVKSTTTFHPLPHMFVIKDLVTDLSNFLTQYSAIMPFLINPSANGKQVIKQSPKDRDKINGLYDCILCACCSAGCPSYWWQSDKFLGPAALLAANRWIEDSRDTAKQQRLDFLSDKFRLYGCKTILNCTQTCPKGLKPSEAIANLKTLASVNDEKKSS
ncbi:MAG: hypothetical protein MHMPM18_000077 [Marteilia pararefringens]